MLMNSDIDTLKSENEAMKKDIQIMATTIKNTLKQLGFLDDSNNFNFNTRGIGKLLPKIMSGEINSQLTGLGDLLPLFEKYKHLAE